MYLATEKYFFLPLFSRCGAVVNDISSQPPPALLRRCHRGTRQNLMFSKAKKTHCNLLETLSNEGWDARSPQGEGGGHLSLHVNLHMTVSELVWKLVFFIARMKDKHSSHDFF